MAKVNPYLNFQGNTEEAFNFYKSVFGGEFLSLARFKDVPQGTPGPTKTDPEGILHVALPISKETILMGSDFPESMGKLNPGNNFSISVSTENEAEADRIYNALSVGGQPTMPIGKTFWGSYFGMCNDKFGIQWMVEYDNKSLERF